ncbi:MAG: ABC transporter permease [Bowdeniella nasicola]|nr:ABC transporter permease [Bowdeniella nasicola]
MTTDSLTPALVHLGRAIRRWRRDRVALVNTIGVPLIMFVIVRTLFGDMMRLAQGVDRLNLVPLTIMLIFTSQTMNCVEAAAGVVRDRQRGMAARVATMPSGSTPLVVGTWLFHVLRTAVTGIVITLVSFAWGLRVATVGAALWLAVVIVGGAVLSATLSTLIAALCRLPESVMGATPLLMAMSFLNAGMVPADRFVEVVQPIARHNPVTSFVQAGIALDGGPLTSRLDLAGPATYVGTSLAWMVGLSLLFGFLAIRPLRRTLV